jgi:hypothetical protein
MSSNSLYQSDYTSTAFAIDNSIPRSQLSHQKAGEATAKPAVASESSLKPSAKRKIKTNRIESECFCIIGITFRELSVVRCGVFNESELEKKTTRVFSSLCTIAKNLKISLALDVTQSAHAPQWRKSH